MKKHPIGFSTNFEKEPEIKAPAVTNQKIAEQKKSVVRVYFPRKGVSYSYYNDRFDLQVGDLVYVEGKLEGCRGQVEDVNYSFKIKLSDYKKVIAVIDTNVEGDLYLAGSHLVSFDKNALPYSKVLTWFKAPKSDEEFVSSDDDSDRFPLNDLSKMKIPHYIADRGLDYHLENRVCYIEIDAIRGHAIVEGSENYEIEFEYIDGEISNLKCTCFCSGACKHEFAAMLQLKESLKLIGENYEDEYNGYFAAISKDVFMNTVMNKKASGKISLGL